MLLSTLISGESRTRRHVTNTLLKGTSHLGLSMYGRVGSRRGIASTQLLPGLDQRSCLDSDLAASFMKEAEKVIGFGKNNKGAN